MSKYVLALVYSNELNVHKMFEVESFYVEEEVLALHVEFYGSYSEHRLL